MNASTSLTPSAGAAAATRPSLRGRLVTDAPTRMFHWLFALSFLGAYLTADGERWRMLHVTLGYTMAGLLAVRLLYGLFGPRQSGLGLLWRRVTATTNWLKSLPGAGAAGGINWQQGASLLMGLSMVALLVLVLPIALSGYATFHDWGEALGGEAIEELHEALSEAYLWIVAGHLALLAGLSVLRRKNMALPMLTGRTPGQGPDQVVNRRWLAAALLLAVLAYGAWEWQQSPNGLIPSRTAAAQGADGPHGAHEDDD